ncbi:MAG: DUF4384 domain-containing protein [Planctomycetes bacterium]|nr:DUF4384 domain-containing protein [Planctomycetota bacterium]
MRTRVFLLPALALVAGLYFWQSTASDQTVPAATWRTGGGAEIKQGHNYDDLAPDSPIRLSLKCGAPSYLYVFSHSQEDGTLLLFPSPEIETDCGNPLPPGRTVLPGRREGQEIAWTSRSGIVGLTTFIAIASADPIPELEELAPRLRLWSNRVFPDHSMVVTKPREGEEVAGGPRQPMPAELLRAAVESTRTQDNPNGPMQKAPGRPGIYVSTWRIRERRRTDATPK